MPPDGKNGFARAPEPLIVGLARTGDREAFAELVRRRQTEIRGLMWRLSGDGDLADDLAQQAFVDAWRDVRQLRQPRRFGAWLKRLAINVWRAHLRKNDPLRHAAPYEEHAVPADTSGVAMDLNRALATLSETPRLCVVLSYHAGMSHAEIAAATELPLGTVKSHIRRATEQLKEQLAAYRVDAPAKDSP